MLDRGCAIGDVIVALALSATSVGGQPRDGKILSSNVRA